MFGFEYEEVHRGSYYLADDPTRERPFSFRLRVKSDGLRALYRERSARAEGSLEAEGLAHDAAVRGLVSWKRSERRIAYALHFLGDDGKRLAFVGEKDLHVMLGVRALTNLTGSLFVLEGKGKQGRGLRREIGRAKLTFDLGDDMWAWIRSMRIKVPGFSLGLPS